MIVKSTFDTGMGTAVLYRLSALEEAGLCQLERLPFSIRVLLENLLRNCDGALVTEADVRALAGWRKGALPKREVPFIPARVMLHDYTATPALVDLAAMRDAMAALGADPERINPLIPVDLVIDHSLTVDAFGTEDAFRINVEREYERNQERYRFFKWAQRAFVNFRAVPPGTGIIHQVNLEYLSPVVDLRPVGDELVAMPDALVATDSHTPMINGLGVLGWGVGGIEAEAAALGQPCSLLIPEVVGFRLTGRLPGGAGITDLALTVTQMLRQRGVLEKFVEFYGPGLDSLSAADRATIANMAPEYGATMAFFPTDAQTLEYLRLSGRDEARVQLVERYCKEQGLFRTAATPDPEFTDTLQLDLSTVEPSLAGPRRPQDRVALGSVRESYHQAFGAGARLETATGVQHGSVVIAAITACTNTSNPAAMVAAGLLARKAVARGLAVKPWVKTSLAPGSRVVTEYLAAADLLPALEALKFHVVGYGCTTCIGGSGNLPDPVAADVNAHDLTVAAVISGNRNFEGRINPLVKAGYLASPALVVAYALAGTVATDLTREPLGIDRDGRPVYLEEIWPAAAEIRTALTGALSPAMFRQKYAAVFDGDEYWQALQAPGGTRFEWNERSTYLRQPPYFKGFSLEPAAVRDLAGARVLALLGDSITTDHISPVGQIAKGSPAAAYLTGSGVAQADFNSFGSRRGNHEVMQRGTFANIRLKNGLAAGREGGYTRYLPTGELLPVWDAAARYQLDGTPLVILAGKEYGMGSSRDWAAKGVKLLGVKAVIAESFERIHRSNLVGMGVLPLAFMPGQNAGTLGLDGTETLAIAGIAGGLAPRQELTVTATGTDGRSVRFTVLSRLDTPAETEYYRNGGILQTVLRRLARA